MNFNDNSEVADAAVVAGGWEWRNARAIGLLEFFRREYEGPYSAPDLLLLGPDQRVIARHFRADELRRAVAEALLGHGSTAQPGQRPEPYGSP